jgi:hypothetical protein
MMEYSKVYDMAHSKPELNVIYNYFVDYPYRVKIIVLANYLYL